MAARRCGAAWRQHHGGWRNDDGGFSIYLLHCQTILPPLVTGYLHCWFTHTLPDSLPHTRRAPHTDTPATCRTYHTHWTFAASCVACITYGVLTRLLLAPLRPLSHCITSLRQHAAYRLLCTCLPARAASAAISTLSRPYCVLCLPTAWPCQYLPTPTAIPAPWRWRSI